MANRRLQEPSFLVLTALADGPQHGYGIMVDVERISELRLRAGTLYTALDRLESEGLIEVDREEIVGGRLRRYYKLTEDGAVRLAAETERLRRHVNVASRRLRASRRPRPAGSAS